ncbi:glycosyltransferase family 39 protein [Sphingomonas sp.]|uniref:glycosyltransferase family 39 protein n=1 Tax=Sphingomonas sp. TaxID=28214 RepID=UPI0035C814CE
MITVLRTPRPATRPTRRVAALLLAIVALAVVLRLYRLDAQPLWIDEDASLEDALAFGRAGLAGLATDHVAPLHTVLLWAVSRIGGVGEWTLRLPSVVAGVLCVPIVFALVRRLFGDIRAALVSALLVAISPFAIWYAQEARMYALLMLLALIHVHLSWPAVGRELRTAELAAVTFVTTLGLYTHHYMLLLSATFGLFLLLAGGASGIVATLCSRRFWAWSATQVFAFALFGFWLWVTADKLGNDAGFSKPAAILWAPYALFSFVTGPAFGPSTAELRGNVGAALRAEIGPIALVGTAAAIVSIAGLRAVLRPDQRVAGAWLLTWLLLPLTLAIAATLLTRIQFNVRYVVFSFPALMILFAFALSDALTAPRRRWPVLLAEAVMVGVMTVSLVNWFTNARYGKEDLRGAAAILGPASRAGVPVVADNQRAVPILIYYGVPISRTAPAVDNIAAGRTPAIVTTMLERAVRRRAIPHLWFISYRKWETDPDHRVQHWLDAHCRVTRVVQLTGVLLRRYAACAPSSGETSVSPPPPTVPGR